MSNFEVGDRVVWHDPDDALCTEFGTVTEIVGDGEFVRFPDTIICLLMDDGSEVECFAEELWKPAIAC